MSQDRNIIMGGFDPLCPPRPRTDNPALSDKDRIIMDYLQEQLRYNERKLSDITEHLNKYPDDEYAKQDKHNCYYLRNVLLAMYRRI